MLQFTINGSPVSWDGDTEQPLLWALRDELGLTGTKFGCGAGLCGACTVHVNGRAQRACITPMASIAGADILTIEGLAQSAGTRQIDGLHPVQQAWLEEDVPQCGYCQAGQIMATAELLARIPNPSDDDIEREQRNLCRCGSYTRIRKAIHRAAELMQEQSAQAADAQRMDPSTNEPEVNA